MTNRALVLSALADSPSQITDTLRSRDTDLMLDALRQLGTDITISPDHTTVNIHPCPLRAAQVQVGLAGTVMRFLPPLAALARGSVLFDGDEQARSRPLSTLLDALRTLGARVEGDRLPFRVHGQGFVSGGEITIDASASSQFVSGLLLSGALFDHGLVVRHCGSALPSAPHIEMTVHMLRECGVAIEQPEPTVWRITPGKIKGRQWQIEPDLSNATPFLAAAAVSGGEVTIPRWPLRTTQPGDAIRDILSEMGAEVSLRDGSLTVQGTGQLLGIHKDLSAIGELCPTIAALAALASTPSTLFGIGHLRGHETNRLAALTADINSLGGRCEELSDGLAITPAPLLGGIWNSFADHRMATAGAIIGLRTPGVYVEDIATTSKTLPDFPQMWTDMCQTVRSGS